MIMQKKFYLKKNKSSRTPKNQHLKKSLVLNSLRVMNINTFGIKINSLYTMADREGFEPSVPFRGTHDFQSCAFDHSAIYPITQNN